MIPRDYNRASRDMQMRKLPVYREPDTVWSIISASPRAFAGSLGLGAVLISIAWTAWAMLP